jgi:hypothetical protein
VAVASTVSTTWTVPAGKLQWGQTFYRVAMVRTTGNTAFNAKSPPYPNYVNALPLAPDPVVLYDEHTTPVSPTVASYIDANGITVWVSPLANPQFYAPYIDPDLERYGDVAVAWDREERFAATPQGSGAVNFWRSSRNPPVPELTAPIIVAETVYDVRGRKSDGAAFAATTLAAASSAGATNVKVTSVTGIVVGDRLTVGDDLNLQETRRVTAVGTAGAGGTGVTLEAALVAAFANGQAVRSGPWGPASKWLRIKVSTPPTSTLVAPGNGAAITFPVRSFSWTYGSVPGKVQQSYQVRIWEQVTGETERLVWDTGVVASTATTVDNPPYLFETGKTYRWDVEVTDTDNLTASFTATKTFTTNFAQPTKLAGLTATTDPQTGAVTLAWTAGATPFWRYRVYQRSAKGEYVRIDEDELATRTTPTFTWLGAVLGKGSAWVVTQHSGAADNGESAFSDPGEAVQETETPGAWAIVTAERAVELGSVTSGPLVYSVPASVRRTLAGTTVTERGRGTAPPIKITAEFGVEDQEAVDYLTNLPEYTGDVWAKDRYGHALRIRVIEVSHEPAARGMIIVRIEGQALD